MSDYRQNNPDYTDKDRQNAKDRMSRQRKDPVKKAEEQERDRIRKKNNKVQKQLDSIFKLNETDKLFKRSELMTDRLCDFNKI